MLNYLCLHLICQDEVMKRKYGDKIHLLFTDTYFLMYEVCTEDLYQYMWPMREEFDIASYTMSCLLYDSSNNKVVRKFHKEARGGADH